MTNAVKPQAADTPPQVLSQQLMWKNNFSYDQIWRANIWAAKYRECPECGAPVGVPCQNMGDLKKGTPYIIRDNKWPHTSRVDYELLLRTLRQRGYR